jgi:hypothetical protein
MRGVCVTVNYGVSYSEGIIIRDAQTDLAVPAKTGGPLLVTVHMAFSRPPAVIRVTIMGQARQHKGF